MKINSIQLKNFRNYTNLNLSFSDDINIIVGNNGQGKTNLLEAIYVLSLTKSFKTNLISNLILFNKDYSKIECHAFSHNQNIQLSIILSKLGKKASINQTEIKKTSNYLGYLNTVLFVPEDLMLVKGSPKQRRNLMDVEITKISPIYIYNLNQYYSLLKERNLYLKKLNIEHKQPDIYLNVLTEQLAHIQIDLIKKRNEFIEQLNHITAKVYAYISSNDQSLTLNYISLYNHLDEQAIINKYKANYLRDIKLTHTLDGIHKDDIQILLNNLEASSFASQGQQRAIVLSIKIALLELIKHEIGEYPILLLDDVLSELDETRQTRLLNIIQNKVQTFLTATSIDKIKHHVIDDSLIISIENGTFKGVKTGRNKSNT